MSRTDLDWDRHPELTFAGFGYTDFVRHDATGCALLHVIIQGRWKSNAIKSLQEALSIMLPGRISLYFVRFGCLRVEVLLAAPLEAGHPAVDRTFVREVVDRSCAAVARAIAAHKSYRLPPPDPGRSVPPPNAAEREQFVAMLDALGDEENPVPAMWGDPGAWHRLKEVDSFIPDDVYDELGSWEDPQTEASLAYYVAWHEGAAS